MIGAGASGFQIAPAIADDVDSLTVFQRTAQWMFPNPNYHAEVGPGVQWALRHLPFYGRWYRFLLFWPGCDKGLEAARVDPDYPDQQKAVSEINEITRHDVHRVDHQPGRRRPGPARQGGARLPGDRQAHAAGQRQLAAHADPRQRRVGPRPASTTSNPTRSSPTTAPATRPTSSCTPPGFQANKMLWPMTIIGRDGEILSERWGERPSAYLGITVPGYPELLLHVRPGHQPRPRRQPDLPLRVPDALHHRVLRAADRRRAQDDGTARGQGDGLARAQPGRDAQDGVVTAVDQALVLQERLRRGAHPEPVAARRLLDVDPRSRIPTTS